MEQQICYEELHLPPIREATTTSIECSFIASHIHNQHLATQEPVVEVSNRQFENNNIIPMTPEEKYPNSLLILMLKGCKKELHTGTNKIIMC